LLNVLYTICNSFFSIKELTMDSPLGVYVTAIHSIQQIFCKCDSSNFQYINTYFGQIFFMLENVLATNIPGTDIVQRTTLDCYFSLFEVCDQAEVFQQLEHMTYFFDALFSLLKPNFEP